MKKQTKIAQSERKKLSVFDSFLDALDVGGSYLGFTDEEVEMAKKALEKAKDYYEEELCLQKEKKIRKEQEERKKELEKVKKATSMEIPMDWENCFAYDERALNVQASSVSDGLILSLTTLGCVDIEYISMVTGKDLKNVIAALKGSIFQNPEKWNECFYKGWETAEEYLSGNLRRKLDFAEKANKKYNGYFSENIKAIRKALPLPIHHKKIYVTLGSPWIPEDVIDDFIEFLFGTPPSLAAYYTYYGKDAVPVSGYNVRHDLITGSWEIPEKNRYCHSIGVDFDYGTPRMNALYILEKTLNMKTIAVYDTVSCATTNSGTRKEINKSDTLLVIERQKKLNDAFKNWIWTDEKRRERLENIYEKMYACVKKRQFDGSFLTFPTMTPKQKLYPYQKDAVARILFTPNTLLAHDVGAGKTYTMIAAGMELKRMGLSKKNMFVVPNNLTGQWKSIYKTLYPDANILCVEPKIFTPGKRNDVLFDIRDKDYDGIIMAYSCFEQIAVSKEFMLKKYRELKEEIDKQLENPNAYTQKLKKRKEKLSKLIKEITLKSGDGKNKVYFDELGINRLFVDEAHNYKNVPIDTKMSKVPGISATGSAKCIDMMNKVEAVQKQNNGGGVVFATGTPITNSITDAYIMQKYLQSGELALLDLQSFDSWVGMFAESVSEFEVDVDTNNYRIATRFSRFHNLPELTTLLSSIADFHQLDETAGIPMFSGYDDTLIGQSSKLHDYLGQISQRAEDIRNGYVSRTCDNMLKITSDGRKAALDIRLVSPGEVFSLQSKVAYCAERVFDIWQETSEKRCTQLVFCDISTPKKDFNMYDELKRLLTEKGIEENEIAFVHEANNEERRKKLFNEMQDGHIRVLIGSTFKLGLGVNVQNKLIAIHHLDVPWRPSDMTQREGRILRQGNTNSKVRIFRYITEGSFDAYSWQLLETKQRFICDLLSGSVSERSGSDVEDTVLNYAEIKALAVGNPAIKNRIETANELTKYLSLQRKAKQTRIYLTQELEEIPLKIAQKKAQIENCRLDISLYNEKFSEQSKKNREKTREVLHMLLKENVLFPRERKAFSYQGFSIILPANMIEQKPFVYLEGHDRYQVELSGSKTGSLIRIDNFLNNFKTYLSTLEAALSGLCERENEVKKSLGKNEDYSEKILSLKEKLEEMDKQLGVNNDD